jgi:hypothetical protein
LYKLALNDFIKVYRKYLNTIYPFLGAMLSMEDDSDSMTTLRFLGLHIKAKATMTIDSVLRDIHVHDVSLKKTKKPAESMEEAPVEDIQDCLPDTTNNAENNSLLMKSVQAPQRLVPTVSFRYRATEDLFSFLAQRKLKLEEARVVSAPVPNRKPVQRSVAKEPPAGIPARPKAPTVNTVRTEPNNATELEQYRQLSELRQWRDDIRRQLT